MIIIWSKRSEQYRGKSEPDDGLLLRCRLPGGGHSCSDGGQMRRLLLQNSRASRQLPTDVSPLDRLFIALEERLESTHTDLLLLLLFSRCLNGEILSKQII